jgi:hypothetical protein
LQQSLDALAEDRLPQALEIADDLAERRGDALPLARQNANDLTSCLPRRRSGT